MLMGSSSCRDCKGTAETGHTLCDGTGKTTVQVKCPEAHQG